uniref:Uncharacterized protein n=1 Tax=Zea mays TaxID=4577 RepID=C4J3L1_MAIZE|nr:unknown [Zea mays]ACR36266.1 unknown [Zea mays]
MASWWCGAFSARKWRSRSRSSSHVAIRFSTIMFTMERRKSLSGSSDCFTTATATLPSSLAGPGPVPAPASQLLAFRWFGACGAGETLAASFLQPLSSVLFTLSCSGGTDNDGGGGGGGGGGCLEWTTSTCLAALSLSMLFDFRCCCVVWNWKGRSACGGGEKLP